MIKAKHPIREAVASLSSNGRIYYVNAIEWWHELTAMLFEHGFLPRFEDSPVFYNNEGVGVVIIEDDGVEAGRIRYTYYRMPETGHWEIICYVT